MPSRQAELFQRAADCERLMNLSSDRPVKEGLRQLRDMWIALANECPGMSSASISNEIAAIDEIQSALNGSKAGR